MRCQYFLYFLGAGSILFFKDLGVEKKISNNKKKINNEVHKKYVISKFHSSINYLACNSFYLNLKTYRSIRQRILQLN